MDYHAFTRELVDSLSANGSILGIVALGSMAERNGRTPDRFSDHDFFVITEEAEPLRSSTEWLPEPQTIVLWFRETAHGCKAIYEDGHLIEYAVFTPDELQLARVNDYRVLLDRERIEERMAGLAALPSPSVDREYLRGMFLSHILVAATRAQRGELLSARFMLTHAMRFLVQLVGGGPDNLDPLRRFSHFNKGEEIERAMQQEITAAARALLMIYVARFGDDTATATVRRTLETPFASR
ncbi:MAG TPA: hypothetical protein VGF48_13635 [Thermoanaerobaculia bacterium]|jgi:hypothetical protein